jgi:hypothetical protein
LAKQATTVRIDADVLLWLKCHKYAALGASAMASVLYGCMAATGQGDLSTLDVGTVTLLAVATFVSTMVTCHPEWIM